jgi:hypothetical protein
MVYFRSIKKFIFKSKLQLFFKKGAFRKKGDM